MVCHIILDHVSLISHYSETHACGVVHGTWVVRLTAGKHLFPDANGSMHGVRQVRDSSSDFLECLLITSALNLSDGSRTAEDNIELQWNRGLLGFAPSDISESVFCIASGQYAKSKFDWQQETPTQRSAALSTAQSLHSGTLPRLDTSGFQMLYHYSAREGVRKSYFPPSVKKNQNKNIYANMQKSTRSSQLFETNFNI